MVIFIFMALSQYSITKCRFILIISFVGGVSVIAETVLVFYFLSCFSPVEAFLGFISRQAAKKLHDMYR